MLSQHRHPFANILGRSTLLAIVAIVVPACLSNYYVRHAEPPPPPPPPPTCSSTPTSVIGLDTTLPSIPNTPYWKFKRVEGASTVLNEFGLIGIGSVDATCLLLRGSSMQTARHVTAVRSTPTSINVGPWNSGADSALLSAVVSTNGLPNQTIVASAVQVDVISSDSLPVSFDDPLAWDAHPTISFSKKWIVFASNRKGSQNSTDLWYVLRRNNGTYSSARPLYGTNSYCDELSPWFIQQPQLALLFSSAGHSSFGGYDVFRAELVEEADSLRVVKVANMGAPINSSADEIFPTTMSQGTGFYVASNRSSGRDSTRKDFDVFVAYQATSGNQPLAQLTGYVINSQTQQPVVDAEVTAREVRSKELYATTRTDTNGAYTLNVPVSTPVQVTAQSDTLFYDSFETILPAAAAETVVTATEPISLSSSFVLRVNFPTAEFARPYAQTLDSNGTESGKSWQAEIDDLARNVVNSTKRVSKIVLVGHTDDVDSDESNRLLGSQRVAFVIDQLVERGVSREILEGTSEGERQPLDKRKGESLDSWRKRCRRVELIKVSQ